MWARAARWFWHALWAACSVLALSLVVLYAPLPVDGVTGDLESFAPHGFIVRRVIEDRNGLRPGDVIVRADGHTVDEWLAGTSMAPAWQSGGVVTYEVLRGGRLRSLAVRLAPTPLATILRNWIPQMIGALAFFAVGTYVFWKKPDELAARLLMLFCLAVAMQFWGDAYNFQYAIIPHRWLLWVQVAYEHGSYSLAIATICYFALLFPDPHPLVRRYPQGVPFILYVSHLVAIVGTMALSPSPNRALELGSHASWALAMLQVGVAIVAGVRSRLVVRDPVKRAQIQWITWTATIGALVMIPGYVLPLVLTGEPILSHPLVTASVSVLPLVLAIVILRYRLFDIEILINRSLVYGTLTALLGGMYLLLIQLLSWLVQVILQRQNDRLAVFLATLSIAFAFAPLRTRVQSWIDRLFYQAKVDYQVLLPEMTDRLATSIVLDQLSTLLTQELPRRLQIAWAELSILDPAGAHIVPVGDGPLPTLPMHHPTVEHVTDWGQPLLRLDLAPAVPAETSSLLEQSGTALLIPLMVGHDLVGLYALGPKLSGDAYSRYDVRLLRILGQQAAVSVQNARLYQQIEAYSHSLEDQVQQRTHELQETYRDLAQQHATINTVLQTIADGLVVTDPEGKIILHNPVFSQMVTYLSPSDAESDGTYRPSLSPPSLVGQRLDQIAPDASLSDAVRQALHFASTVITVDATWSQRTYRASARALGRADLTVSGVVTILRDITQEVEMSRMKDEFVSMVSHELRTPLTSIIGFTHLIHRHFTANLDAYTEIDELTGRKTAQRILGNLEIIIDQGERLTRLIGNILDLSRMEAGHVQWDMARLDIAEMVAESIRTYQPVAAEKGIGIVTEIAENLPPVYGDRDRLIQVMTNLLSNAIKFTDRGEVRVRVWQLEPGDDVEPFSTRQPNVHLHLPATEPCVVVSIQDTGTGIAEADLPYVFERFRQVGDEVSGTRRPGSGLGLTISKEIVEYHGGQIWVESQLGIGSRFVFTLYPM
jgi:signal transduction histidine kinase/GAF domain-containing protein